jgi:probable phosphoglycerate mutase
MARVRSVDLGSSFLPSLEGVCEVLLVRHGEQVLTENMPLVEAVDPPLSELGIQQARALGERCSAVEIDAVYSSTMRRAADTAGAIAAHHDLPVTRLDDLVEINLWRDLPQDRGILDSVDVDEVRRIMREGNRSRRWDSYPYSEPPTEFRSRVVEAIDGIMADHVDQRVVVGCHGGVINAYLAHVIESSLDNVCTVHHTSITTVRGMDDLRRVVQVNDHDHVRSFQTELNPANAL